jgi:hypothetical protein
VVGSEVVVVDGSGAVVVVDGVVGDAASTDVVVVLVAPEEQLAINITDAANNTVACLISPPLVVPTLRQYPRTASTESKDP